MKKLIKSALSLLIVGVMLFSLASCSFVSPYIGESGYFGIYKSVDLPSADSVVTSINNKVVNENYNAYTVTYVYEHANKAEGYDYTNKYDLTAKINTAAMQNEVFALFNLKVDYKQANGQHSVDADIEICIVRTGEGDLYSDHTVYAQVNGTSYTATFSQMKDKVELADRYYEDVQNDSMKSALDTGNTNSSPYLELVLTWVEVEYGDYIVSTGDNPLIHATHDYNKGMFVQLVYDAKNGSEKQYKVSTSGDDKFRASRSYSTNEQNFKEEMDVVAFLKLNDDGTYTSKYSYEYMKKHPYEDRSSTYERELEPLEGKITRPAFAS